MRNVFLFCLVVPATAFSACANVLEVAGNRVLVNSADRTAVFSRSERLALVRLFDRRLPLGEKGELRAVNDGVPALEGAHTFSYKIPVQIREGRLAEWQLTEAYPAGVDAVAPADLPLVTATAQRMTSHLLHVLERANIRSPLLESKPAQAYVFGFRYYLRAGVEYSGVPVHRDNCRFQGLVVLQRSKRIAGGATTFRTLRDFSDAIRVSGIISNGDDQAPVLSGVNHLLAFDGSNVLHGSEGFSASVKRTGGPGVFLRDILGVCLKEED